MYDTIDNFDPAVLLGRELEQVSYTLNTVGFVFDGGVSIAIGGVFEESPARDRGVVRQDFPVFQSGLMALAGQKIVSARILASATLVLGFEGGGMIRCIKDTPFAESYVIRVGEKEFVV